MTPAGARTRRLLALLCCRLYAVLPCVITVLVAGALCASPHGVLSAALLTGVCFAVMALRFRDFLERPAAALLNAVLFGAVLALPAAIVPWRGASGFAAGALLEMALDVGLLAALPHLPRRLSRALQPELYADVLTGTLLTLLLWLPLRLLPRAKGGAPARSEPPFQVAVVLCGYEEHETIDRSLDSVLAAAERVRGTPLVRDVRVVLAESSRDAGTRERLAPRVARVLAPSGGKLSARHQATLLEPCDIVVAADADRAYEADWLRLLLEPFRGADVVASMGETRNEGAGPSGSALCRALLKLPFNGGNSAYLREAYLSSPFDPATDQFNHRQLWLEEEFLFGLKLQALGRVAHVPECRSYELRPYPFLRQLARHLFGTRLRTF